MSETQNKPEEKRTPFILNIDPIEFEADAEVKILPSNEFCRMTNEIFKAAFSDYEGCMFEMSQGTPTITLIFNHCVHNDGNNYAVAMVDGKKSGNTVLDRSRAYDRLVKEGDRYHITDDGKDVITSLLVPRYFNNNKPNWGFIVTDYVDRSGSYYGPNNGIQFTKIIGIDPKAICAMIYGKKENGSYLDYAVEVKADLSVRNNFGYATPNYVLSITKAYNEHITKTYEKLGFGSIGSNIIRC